MYEQGSANHAWAFTSGAELDMILLVPSSRPLDENRTVLVPVGHEKSGAIVRALLVHSVPVQVRQDLASRPEGAYRQQCRWRTLFGSDWRVDMISGCHLH